MINEGRYEAALEALNSARATFGPHPDVLTYLGFALPVILAELAHLVQLGDIAHQL